MSYFDRPKWHYALGAGVALLSLRFIGKTMMDRASRQRTLDIAIPRSSLASLNGKRAVVFGGTAGLGFAIAKKLAEHGAEVSVVGRRSPNDPQLKHIPADLSTISKQLEVANTVENPESLDIVVFTQGIITAPQRQVSSDGIELDLAISYISRRIILERLFERGARSRFFVMGFPGVEGESNLEDFNAEQSYSVMKQHFNTVVGNEALVHGARERFAGIRIFGLNPGFVKTEIRDNLLGKNSWTSLFVENTIALFTPTAQTYSNRIVSVIANENIPDSVFHFNCFGEPIRPSNFSLEKENVDRVWKITDELIQRATK
jgi:NAD(P)-dependent dehydrogenase (short-subunit alcohol dehydrogenase family)